METNTTPYDGYLDTPFIPGSPHLFAAGAVYLAILLMNTLVPLIDRVTQPRPFGH